MYKARFNRGAKKALSEKLPTGVAWAVIEFIEGPLCENPQRLSEELDDPFKGCRSARRSSYRVLFKIKGTTLHIIDVAYHDDIYRPR